MKKRITLCASLLLLANGIQAQKTNLNIPQAKKAPAGLYTGKVAEVTRKSTNETEKNAGDVLWSNNFDAAGQWTSIGVGGTPALNFGWQYGQFTTPPADALTWFFNDGTNPPLPLNSTSGGGFAVVENGNPSAATPNQIPNSQWILMYDSVFNFSPLGDLYFQFEEYGAAFLENQAVEISIDNGANWIEIGNNDDLGELNQISGSLYANPTVRRYNVSSVLGTAIPASLKFRFRVSWPAGLTAAQNGVMYGWFVDDVKFIEGYPNDLKMEAAYARTGTEGLYYSRFPASQAAGGNATTTISARINNTGSAPQNTTLTATNPIGSFTGTSATPVTQTPYNDSDSLIVSTDYTIPVTVGPANFTVSASSNNTLGNTADDSQTVRFQVTPNIMAVDSYTNAASMTGAFTEFVNQTGTNVGIGTLFQIFEDGIIGGYQVGIADLPPSLQATYIGRNFFVSFWRVNASNVLVAESAGDSEEKQLTNANFGNLVNFNLSQPIAVQQGDVIAAIATAYNGQEVPFAFAGVSLAGTTVGILNDNISGLAAIDETPTFVEAPVVRIDFSSHVGLSDPESVANVSVAPNPFADVTNINFTLKTDADASVVVTDVTGREVMNVPAAKFTAGNQSIAIDGSAFKAGVYNYTLKVGNNVTTKRVIKK